MSLKLIGDGSPLGTQLIDEATGEDVLPKLCAAGLRLVVRSGVQAPTLEVDQFIAFDHKIAGAIRAFTGCPETGKSREIKRIEFADGGVLDFPRDFSAVGAGEQAEQAAPKIASASTK